MKTPWIVLIIGLLAAARLIPHAPNFTPILSCGLLAGLMLRAHWLGYGVPLVAMLASDVFLGGFYPGIAFVYLGVAAATFIGQRLRGRAPLRAGAIGAVGASLVFFFVSNFGVWLMTNLYEKSLTGLATCIEMGIPFYTNSLVSTLLFTLVPLAGIKMLGRLGDPLPSTLQPAREPSRGGG